MRILNRFTALYNLALVGVLQATIGCYSKTIAPEKSPREHNVVHCSLFDMKGNRVWSTKGYQCLFLEDGGVIVASRTNIRRLDKSMRVLWRLNTHVHHQMNWSSDKKEILLISQTDHLKNSKLVKYDTLKVIDLNGKIKKEFSFHDHRNDISKRSSHKTPLWTIPYEIRANPKVGLEFSHTNSFYEIPKNMAETSIPAFSKGNYIVNMNKQYMMMIIDSKMKEILWSLQHDEVGDDISIHDVQVTPEGKLLFFYNRREASGYSSVENYDPISKKSAALYKDRDPPQFFELNCGGVQLLDNGNILTHRLRDGHFVPFEFNRQGQVVWEMTSKHLRKQMQQVKRIDASSFLRQNEKL